MSTVLSLDAHSYATRKQRKIFEPEGFEKYGEVNNKIKRCVKENWIAELCGAIEKNLHGHVGRGHSELWT